MNRLDENTFFFTMQVPMVIMNHLYNSDPLILNKIDLKANKYSCASISNSSNPGNVFV